MEQIFGAGDGKEVVIPVGQMKEMLKPDCGLPCVFHLCSDMFMM